MLSSSLPSPPPEQCEAVVRQERQSFSLILTHSPCPGAPAHHFILPAQLSLSPLKPSLTRRCHNKPTLAVSPQHLPSFAFLYFHLILHSTLTRTLKYSLPPLILLCSTPHSFKPSSNKQSLVHFQAVALSWCSFRTQILHFIHHFTKSVYRANLNFNRLMLSAVNTCAQNTLWPAQTSFIHIASESVLTWHGLDFIFSCILFNVAIQRLRTNKKSNK